MDTNVDPTKGVTPILSDGCTMVINDSIYRIPRIGWKDMFRFFRFIQELSRTGAVQSSLLDHQSFQDSDEDASRFFINLATGAIASEDKIYEFISPILLQKKPGAEGAHDVWVPVPVEDLQDPSKFPADTFLQVLMALGQHPDVTAFFRRWVDLQATLTAASGSIVDGMKAMTK